MQFIGEFGIIEWSMRLQQCAFRLHESDRFFRNFIAELFGMGNIVTADTEYLHIQQRFYLDNCFKENDLDRPAFLHRNIEYQNIKSLKHCENKDSNQQIIV